MLFVTCGKYGTQVVSGLPQSSYPTSAVIVLSWDEDIKRQRTPGGLPLSQLKCVKPNLTTAYSCDFQICESISFASMFTSPSEGTAVVIDPCDIEAVLVVVYLLQLLRSSSFLSRLFIITPQPDPHSAFSSCGALALFRSSFLFHSHFVGIPTDIPAAVHSLALFPSFPSYLVTDSSNLDLCGVVPSTPLRTPRLKNLCLLLHKECGGLDGLLRTVVSGIPVDEKYDAYMSSFSHSQHGIDFVQGDICAACIILRDPPLIPWLKSHAINTVTGHLRVGAYQKTYSLLSDVLPPLKQVYLFPRPSRVSAMAPNVRTSKHKPQGGRVLTEEQERNAAAAAAAAHAAYKARKPATERAQQPPPPLSRKKAASIPIPRELQPPPPREGEMRQIYRPEYGLISMYDIPYSEYERFFSLKNIQRAAKQEAVDLCHADADKARAALAAEGEERTRLLKELTGQDFSDDASDAPGSADLEEYAQQLLDDADRLERLFQEQVEDTSDDLGDGSDDEELRQRKKQRVFLVRFTQIEGVSFYFHQMNDGVVPEEPMRICADLFSKAAEVPGAAVCFIRFIPSTQAEFRIHYPPNQRWRQEQSMRDNVRMNISQKKERAREVLGTVPETKLCSLVLKLIVLFSVLFALSATVILNFFEDTVHFGKPHSYGETVDYYQVLNVSRNATPKDVKKAYYSMVRQYHPDSHPNCAECPAKFAQMVEAYEVLSDPARREWFDSYGTDMPDEEKNARHEKQQHPHVRPARSYI